MVDYHKEGNTSAKIIDRPMLGFWDAKKWDFPLVIMATIGKLDMAQILIDGGNSYDIMYSKIFGKMNLDRSKLLTN